MVLASFLEGGFLCVVLSAKPHGFLAARTASSSARFIISFHLLLPF